LASGPMHRRAQWPGYRPARSGLSTPIVKKLSHRSQDFWDAKKSLCFGPLAALEPHSCDVLTIAYALNRRVPVGAAGVQLPGTGGLEEPVAFPTRPGNFERSCSPLTFEIVAGLLLASDSRISMRAATPCSGIVPLKGRKHGVWIGRGSCRMSMEFGGTQG
jgi:hypothetical protein